MSGFLGWIIKGAIMWGHGKQCDHFHLQIAANDLLFVKEKFQELIKNN
jgi:hypothetical protein